MKKLMLSAVVLLPLVILMILLLSGAVVGMITHVYVEALEFRQPETLVLVMSDESDPPSEKLQINILPLSASNAEVRFSSDDESIVKVDEEGVVTAVYYGETYVRVTSVENETASAMRRVRVTDTRVHSLKFSGGYPSAIYIGETQRFTVGVYPFEAENKLVYWTSSDPAVLDIAPDGTATAYSYGDVTVTATSAENTGIKISVTVKCRAPLAGLYFASNEQYSVQSTASLDAKFPAVYFSPVGAQEDVAYSSSDEGTAIVDNDGNIAFMKAGRVTIAATARDGLGNEFSIRKDFISTDGHTMGDIFKKAEYEINYEDYDFEDGLSTKDIGVGFNDPLSLKFDVKQSEVEFKPSGVITFDEDAQKFYLVEGASAKDGVRVMINTRKYKRGTVTQTVDLCRVYVQRKIESIDCEQSMEVSRKRVDLLLDSQDGLVKFSPANHTADIKYEIESSSIATADDSGVIRFSQEGTAVVGIIATDFDGAVLKKNITVTYAKQEYENDKTLVLSDGARWTLKTDGTDCEMGVISATGNIESCTSSDESVAVIEENGGQPRVVPKKGGYSDITVVADGKTYKARLYVDRAIDDIYFEKALPSAKDSVAYTVKVLPSDAMVGKELRITADGTTVKAAGTTNEGAYAYSSALNFDYACTKRVEARVWQEAQGGFVAADGAAASALLRATCGELIAHPEVRTGDIRLDENSVNEIQIDNLGGKAEFSVSGLDPADFELGEDTVTLTDSPYVDLEIKDGKVILTGTTAGADDVRLTIGGKSFDLHVVVNALSQFIEVRQGNILVTNGEYITLTDKLTFDIRVGRKDSVLTDNSAEVIYDGISHKTVDSVTVDVGGTGVKQIVFKPSDGGAAPIAVNVRRVTALPDFGLSATYVNADSQLNTLKIYDSVRKAQNMTFVFPKNMQGTMTLNIILPFNFLGGFGSTDESALEAFERAFELDRSEIPNWELKYNVASAAIILTPNETAAEFERKVTLTYSDIKREIVLRRVDISNFEPTGYDIDNKQDVYLGYQQVRLFAKHSYYNGKAVDYYKVPFAIEGNKDHVRFTMARYVGDEFESIITTQTGKKVEYKGVEYEMVGVGGEYYLQDKKGEAVRGIGWVDVYSEPGYMRIYFGDFEGLSESDVQNDYFGNFGERDGWQMPAPVGGDGTERTFAPSANAFAFMRITADDGSEGGTSWHYNFNVLSDLSENEYLYNVSDAAGFEAAGDVVLQHSLFAPDEREGTEKQYILGAVTNPNKRHIYGNGFQINFKAYNDASRERSVVTVMAAYNTVFKGSIPKQSVSYETFKLSLEGKFFYYCDIQCMYRGVDEHTDYATYIKNTVVRYTFEGIYMNAENTSIYIENIVMIDVLKALNTVANNHFYVKGYVDILNYYNRRQLISALLPEVAKNSDQLAVIDDFMDDINSYSEWFGESGGMSRDYTHRFVNMALLGEKSNSPTRTVFFWNEDEQKYEEGLGSSQSGDGGLKKMASISVMIATLTAWSYDCTNDTDGGVIVLDEDGGLFYQYLSQSSKKIGNKMLKDIAAQMDCSDDMTDKEVYEIFKATLNNIYNGGESGYGELYGPLILNEYKATLTDTVNTSSRDMTDVDKLFTDERYIRLLCQFKGIDDDGNMIVNSNHQLWHMQRVYREHELVGEDGWSFDEHISDLKASLAGSSWDGYTWTGERMIDTSSSPSARSASFASSDPASELIPRLSALLLGK